MLVESELPVTASERISVRRSPLSNAKRGASFQLAAMPAVSGRA